MPLVKMRTLPLASDSEDVLVNTDAIQMVLPFGDGVILVVIGKGNSIRCEGTIEAFQSLIAEAGGK